MKTNLQLEKELRELYLKTFENGNFVDIQRIKYEIRKVKNRKNNNKLEVITRKRKGQIILVINGNEILEMKYKKGLGKLLVGITLELEHQIESRKRVISYLKTITNITIEELTETLEDEVL